MRRTRSSGGWGPERPSSLEVAERMLRLHLMLALRPDEERVAAQARGRRQTTTRTRRGRGEG